MDLPLPLKGAEAISTLKSVEASVVAALADLPFGSYSGDIILIKSVLRALCSNLYFYDRWLKQSQLGSQSEDRRSGTKCAGTIAALTGSVSLLWGDGIGRAGEHMVRHMNFQLGIIFFGGLS